MDVKSLAKSKRAHSLHNSKKHQPNRTAKAFPAAPVTAAGVEKKAGKQVKEKPEQSRSSKALPSNWDRYNDESGSDAEDKSQESNKATDVPLPKSKGMDYSHLITEAKARSQTTCSLQSVPSFDDVVDDLNQGMGPLLTVRGQSILSWIADDNFELEDKATANDKYEAPFLSLDLTALAEQLAKASLSERLFIEPDLFPLEMFPELRACGHDKLNQDQATIDAEVVGRTADSLQLNDVASSYDTTATCSAESPHGDLKSVNPVKDDFHQLNETDEGKFSESASGLDTDSVRPPIFEAGAVEAELDMLLDSFTKTNFLESTSGTEKLEGTSSNLLVSSQSTKKGLGVTKSVTVAANFDDTIDELLEQTSNVVDGSLSHEVKEGSHDVPSTSNPVSKSKLLDDFDSWLDTI